MIIEFFLFTKLPFRIEKKIQTKTVTNVLKTEGLLEVALSGEANEMTGRTRGMS